MEHDDETDAELEEETRLRRARLERELVDDAPGTTAGSLFFAVVEDGAPRARMILALGHAHAGFVDALAQVLARREPPVTVDARLDAALTPAEHGQLETWCAAALDAALATYVPRPELPEWVAAPLALTWRDREHVVQQRQNQVGQDIGSLYSIHTFFGAAAPPASIQVFGNAGVTVRDAAVLGLAAAAGASCTLAELRATMPFVPPEAIEATVAKLAARGFVTREGEQVQLSIKGYVVSMPGPAE